MTRQTESDTLQQAIAIDEICDAFEHTWRGDNGTRLEPFLESASETVNRGKLLRSLLVLEFELRSRVGTLPAWDETIARFPDDEAVVKQAYHDALEFAADREVPRELAQYRLDAELGRGTFGTVYRAYDQRLKRPVALKVLHPWFSASATFVQRFEREAQAASNLQHANICMVFDIGFDQGRHFYAMQFCQGPNLAEYLAVKGPLPYTEATRIVGALAQALHESHEHGIIHRDMKPANVLLPGGGDIPVITDFGLAHDRDHTLQGDPLQVAGTPDYMAPEQHNGDVAATVAQDIYSLGAILSECLMGSATPDTRARTAHRVPVELLMVCRKAMDDDPMRRYGSAAEFSGELSRVTTSVNRRRRKVNVVVTVGLFAVALLALGNHRHRLFPLGRSGSPSPIVRATADSQEIEQRIDLWDENHDIDQPGWDKTPPPLDTWIAGRDILTVAQDGTAMFTTISAALTALEPHQVVQVLDTGPYQESIWLDRLPSNTGLVSLVGTQVLLPEWRVVDRDKKTPYVYGCLLNDTTGFRLTGFNFVAPLLVPQATYRATIVRLRAIRANYEMAPLIIEDCSFRWHPEQQWPDEALPDYLNSSAAMEVVATRESRVVHIRHCEFHDSLDVNAYAPTVISHNTITSPRYYRGLGIMPGSAQITRVHDNVISASVGLQIGVRQPKHYPSDRAALARSQYLIKNNYFEGEVGIDTCGTSPATAVIDPSLAVIEHNLINCRRSLTFDSSRDREFAHVNWKYVGNVRIGEAPSGGELLHADWYTADPDHVQKVRVAEKGVFRQERLESLLEAVRGEGQQRPPVGPRWP